MHWKVIVFQTDITAKTIDGQHGSACQNLCSYKLSSICGVAVLYTDGFIRYKGWITTK